MSPLPLTAAAARLLIAGLLGGAIGVERELRKKPAGLRTNVLISVGAALYSLLSLEMAGSGPSDPTRIAAQVVSGVGFIGAGVILRGSGGVAGITTAATIFVVAAVGLAAGAGLWKIATLTTAIVVAALLALSPLERWLRPLLPRRHPPDAENHPDEHG